MRYILTNEQMKEADGYTIRTLGVPSLELMERAGQALADTAETLAPKGRVLCICGGGNNGGDGFVCARLLHIRGREVDCLQLAEKESEECAINRERYEALPETVFYTFPDEEYALIIDCLFGTGFRGDFPYADIQKRIENSGAKVLSADIPSGVRDDGSVANGAIRASVTLCIGEKKAGCYLGEGISYSGKILCADIGIKLPREDYARLSDRETVKTLLPKRKRYSHKGSYGKAAIVAGSIDYTGAAYLAGAACLRSGTGYTTLFTPTDILPYYILKAPEMLLKPINDGGRYAFNEGMMQQLLTYDAIAYGMGMGATKSVYEGVKYLLNSYTGRLILDADALNALALYGDGTEFMQKKCAVVITPHIKEFSRLSGVSVERILSGGLDIADEYAKKNGITVLLKNAVSVITDGERKYLNATGNSGQAKGGSGDVLAGLCAGLCASGASVFDGAVAASYLCGKSAEFAVAKTGEYALCASDLIDHLGKAFLFVTENACERGDEE